MPHMNPSTRDSLKAGCYTALWTFLALFGVTLLGWSSEVIRWAQDWGSTGTPSTFPSLSVLASGAVAAVFAGLSGLVGAVVRLAQARLSAVPGHPPHYD